MKQFKLKEIFLAGGCFWGVEHYFSKIPGVIQTEVGYANGHLTDTQYTLLKETGHAEVVRICFDQYILSLPELLFHYFRIIDPSSLNKQGNDIGLQYRTGIYYRPSENFQNLKVQQFPLSPLEQEDFYTIEDILAYQKTLYSEFYVEYAPLKNYVKAEEYHQAYLEKNPEGYCHLLKNLASLSLFPKTFSKPSDETLKANLSDLAYSVTQEAATERAFTSEYTDEQEVGLYVNIVTGEPLFSSEDKFDSGCGWPSFTKPLLTESLYYQEDYHKGYARTEVKTNKDDAHLGHVFEDGPEAEGGLRYCINGAALRFIPIQNMEKEGYGDYLYLFSRAARAKLLEK